MKKQNKAFPCLFLTILLTSIPFSALSFSALSSEQIQSNFHDEWVKPSDKLTISIPPLESGFRHAFFFGNTDVTQLFVPIKPGEYTYQTEILPLKSGEQSVLVYLIDATNNWSEAANFNLKVLSAGGFEEAEFSPSMTVTVDSQWDEGHSGDAPPPNRQHFHDISAQAALQTRHAKPGLEISSSSNLVAASYKEKTLRFDIEGDSAPKIDLSDYIVDVIADDLSISVGHISDGNHPLLFSEVNNRGILGNYRINDYFDIGMSSQNGTNITGYNNVLGLASSQHMIIGGSLGWEVFPANSGKLRAEFTYVNASIESQSDFDVGEVTDAEENDGWGLRLRGQLIDGRLRYDGSYARSNFTNPNDPLLSQGDNLVPVKETSDYARFIEVGYDIFTDTMETDSIPFTAGLTFTHEKNDPLYRSLAASTIADIERNTIALQGTIESISYTLSYSLAEDNLDNIDNILKTRTKDWTGVFDMPLSELLGISEAQSQYWPSLSIAAQRVHQYAINSPAAEGDFNSTNHLPDQMNDNITTLFNWGFQDWDLGYEFGYSNQDNRQTGRDKADFKTLINSININARPTEKVSITFSLGRADTKDVEQKINNMSDTGSFALDWQIGERLAFSGSFNKSYDHDSLDAAKSISDTYELTLKYQFNVKMSPEKKIPSQFFLRLIKQDSMARDKLFGFKSDAATWMLSTGLSMNF